MSQEDDVDVSYPEDWRQLTPEKWGNMRMSPAEYQAMRAFRLERERRAPRVGDAGPDFEAERLTPEGGRTGATFRLSSSLGRPIGLVFGSYT